MRFRFRYKGSKIFIMPLFMIISMFLHPAPSLEIGLSYNFRGGKLFKDLSLFIDDLSWLDRAEFAKKLEQVDFSRCSLCNLKGSTNSNSCKRDLVLSIHYGSRTINLLTFVRSLRSVKSKCTIVILHSKEMIESIQKNYPSILQELIKCGTILLNFGNISTYHNIRSTTSRQAVTGYFIKYFEDFFDRVIVADSFDTFFQMDPFRPEFEADKVRLTVENDNLALNTINSGWMRDVDEDFDLTFYWNKKIICSGLIYGGMKPMSRLMDVFIDVDLWLNLSRHNNDQPIMNLLYYRLNAFDSNVLLDENVTNMVSAASWVFKEFPDKDGLMRLADSRYPPPTAIHQYNRICPVIRFVEYVCPVLGSWDESTRLKWKIIQDCKDNRKEREPM
jgi:hypothetical protein